MDDLSSWLKNSLKYSIEEGKSLGTLREAYQRLVKDPGNIDHAVRWQTALAPHLPLIPAGHDSAGLLDVDLMKVIRRRDKFYEDLLDLLLEQLGADPTGILLEFAQDLKTTLDIVSGDPDCPSEVCRRAQGVRRILKGKMEGLGGESPAGFITSPSFPTFPGSGAREPRPRGEPVLPPPPAPLPEHVPAPIGRKAAPPPAPPAPPAAASLPFEDRLLRLNIALLRARENGDLVGASQALQAHVEEASRGGPGEARRALHDLEILARAHRRVPAAAAPGPAEGQALLHVLARAHARLVEAAQVDRWIDELVPRLEQDLLELLAILQEARGPAFRPAIAMIAAKIVPVRGRPEVRPYREVLRLLPDLVPVQDPRIWRIPAEVARRQVEAEEDGKVLTVDELVRLVVRDSLKDGQLSAKENQFLKVLTRTLGIPPEKVKEMVRIEAKVVEEAGRDPGELDEKNLFRRAVFVAAADGVFQDQEKKLLVALANILRLPTAVAQEVLDEGKRKLIEVRQASATIQPPKLSAALAKALESLKVLDQVRRTLPALLPRPVDHWSRDPSSADWSGAPENPFDLRLRVLSPAMTKRPSPLIALDFRGSPATLHAWLAGDHLEVLVRHAPGGSRIVLNNRDLDREILTTPLLSGDIAHDLEAWLGEGRGGLDIATVEWETGAIHRIWTVPGTIELSGHLGLAVEKLGKGDRDGARELLEKAHSQSPRGSGILWRLGAQLQLSGRSNEAESCWVRELEQGSPAPEAGVHLARLCWRTGRKSEALRRLGAVLATCPAHVPAWIMRIEMWLQDRNDPAEARPILELLAMAKYRAPEEPALAAIVAGVAERLGRPIEDELWLHLGNRETSALALPAPR